MKVILISAVSLNNAIGKEGKIPWHSQSELNHFKNATLGFPIIMGRKTGEALGKPLTGRINIILTRQKEIPITNGFLFFNSIQESLSYCERENFKKCFIIGGGEIYKQTINLADELFISRMKFEKDGDVFFPWIDLGKWEEKMSEDFDEFTFHMYIRKEKLSE